MGILDIGEMLRRARLRWFGHVMRKEDDDWVKRCMNLEVEGNAPKFPRKTCRYETEGIEGRRLCRQAEMEKGDKGIDSRPRGGFRLMGYLQWYSVRWTKGWVLHMHFGEINF